LNPKCRGEKDVDFTRLNFLEISSGNLGSFGQLVLRQATANPLSSHIRAKHLNSRPLFLGYGHDILHRFEVKILNDTYIVKKTCHLLGKRCRKSAAPPAGRNSSVVCRRSDRVSSVMQNDAHGKKPR
jgi:hypothetical protein